MTAIQTSNPSSAADPTQASFWTVRARHTHTRTCRFECTLALILISSVAATLATLLL